MKKVVWILAAAAVLMIVLLVGFSLTNVPDAASGTVYFAKNGEVFSATLTEEDVAFVENTFSGKLMYYDTMYCGFSEENAIRLDNQVFYIAQDGCSVVYWKNKNRYFNLSDKALDGLEEKLKAYGYEH